MTVTPARTSAQNTHTPTTRSAEKLTLEDAAHLIRVSATSLDWLNAVLHAIEVLNGRGGGAIHIKYLAELGQYVISNIGSVLDNEREKLATCGNAGEVRK